MENRCNFNPVKVDFWNDIYSLFKQLPQKVFAEFNWRTFEHRKLTVVGATHFIVLDSLKKSLLERELRVDEIHTRHYDGLYFEAAHGQSGLIIAPIEHTDELALNVGELRDFGRSNNLINLAELDDLSGELLSKYIDQVFICMLGVTPIQLEDIQANGIRFNPERVAFWSRYYAVIRNAGSKVFTEFDWKTFNQRRFPVFGVTDVGCLQQLHEQLTVAEFQGIRFDTLHYQGIYYHGGPDFGGLLIAPRPEFLTVDQFLFQPARELRLMLEMQSIGREFGFGNLADFDELSGALLTKKLVNFSSDYQRMTTHELKILRYEKGIKFSDATAFWCEIYEWLRQYNLKVYMATNWQTIHRQKFQVVGVVAETDLEALRSCMFARSAEVTEIETVHYRGFYSREPSDYGKSSQRKALFIAPREQIVAINSNIMNLDMDALILLELQNYGRDHQLEELISIDFSSGELLGKNLQVLLLKLLGLTYPQLTLLRCENTHQDFWRHFLELMNGGETSSTTGADGAGYSNTREFSRIYYHEIRIINRLFGSEPVSIHDVGTCTAQFPLLLSRLAAERKIDLEISRIIASDYHWTGENDVRAIIRKNGYQPIEFLNLDLTKDVPGAPVTDVIIANDVLEHLPDDRTSFSVLISLWQKVGKLLLVHVPMEDTPNPLWDHHVAFNETKLREWAGKLTGGRFLSDQFFDGTETLTAYGFLIIVKEPTVKSPESQ